MAEALRASTVLARTELMLATARIGLHYLTLRPRERRISGLMIIAVFGRSVTLTLQNLRTVDRERFNAWYAPYEQEMATDPVFQRLTKLRNAVLKEGISGERIIIRMPTIADDELRRICSTKPPNAHRGPFVDQLGVLWEVRNPDGTIDQQYIDVSEETRLTVWWSLIGLADLAEDRPEISAVVPICHRYLTRLSEIVAAARAEFGVDP